MNLRSLATSRVWWLRVGGAVASGLLLCCAFAPLEWDVTIWFALPAVLMVSPPPSLRGRFLLGYLLGLVFCIPNLAWLNEVGFGAGFLLALVIACYPMLWYVGSCAVARELCDPAATDANGAAVRSAWHIKGAWRQIAFSVAAALLWVALEWIRSWLFTGFPWNQLGICLWQRRGLLQITTITGVYGLSFLIVCTNMALLYWLRRLHRPAPGRGKRRVGISWPVLFAGALFVPVLFCTLRAPRLPEPKDYLRVLSVQGNIPQCRIPTLEQTEEATSVYTGITRLQATVTEPDLVVWPESAIPEFIARPAFRKMLSDLVSEIKAPLLLGAIDARLAPGTTVNDQGQYEPPPMVFNSAYLLGIDGETKQFYDKIHTVPFGEFTPFAEYLPWLVEWIGMGRGLTRGTEYTVFDLDKGVKAGVNICFEDVFPEISGQFVLHGANMLMTITNDAWYAESAGSRQHAVHAIFRAVETRRPLFRAGNNSDTCLVLPSGQMTDLLHDPVTGNRFVRGAKVYRLPVWDAADLGITFYTRHGDIFAKLCSLAAAGILVWLAWRAGIRRRRLRIVIEGDKGP